MPSKMIYVADADLTLFERARALAGGNLSAAIVQSVRRFVEIKEAQLQGYDDVEVRVGRDGIYHRKRFVARRIAQWKREAEKKGAVEYFVVYQTQKGRYAVHTTLFGGEPERARSRSAARESWHPGSDWQDTSEYWEDVTNVDDWVTAGDTDLRLAVHGDLAALQAAVPPELGRLVEINSQQLPVEELDI